MNMLPGTLRRDGGGALVDLAGGLSLPAPPGVARRRWPAVFYGVRPEHFAVADTVRA